jgi:hypothetical protein
MSSIHRYRLHGLALDSTRALPAAPRPTEEQCDCLLQFVDEARYQQLTGEVGRETLCEIFEEPAVGEALSLPVPDRAPAATLFRTRDRGYELLFDDRTRVLISEHAERITVTHPLPAADAATMHLLGQGIGFALRLRGHVALHASCVTIDGAGVSLAGPSTAGKSTTAAAFSRRGNRVVTENVTAIAMDQRPPLVLAGSSRFLLFDDSAQALFGDADAFPVVNTVAAKRVVEGRPPDAAAVSLAIILVLDRATESLPEPLVRQLDAREALLELLHNSYGSAFFTPEMRAENFEQMSRLAQEVPVLGFRVGKDLRALPMLCDSIERVVRDVAARRV